MIARIKGEIVERGENFVILDVAGVGYKVYTNSSDNNGEAIFYTHLNVKEDALDLYGFKTNDELSLFNAVLSVSGVGPKTALSILSSNTAANLNHAIAESKPELLMGPGIGKKTAERIILELSGKLKLIDRSDDLYSALNSLGYTDSEAKAAVSSAPAEGEVGERLKVALKTLRK